MRQKIVLQKISKEMRDLHRIEIHNHSFHYHGQERGAYIGFPVSLIKEIKEDKITIHVELRDGVLTLWKAGPPPHLTLFDRKAQNRKIARDRREKRKKREVIK